MTSPLMDERHQVPADLKLLMQQPAFRRWLLRLVGRCGIFASTFGPDSRTAAWTDGRRTLGLELLNDIAAIEPDALARILSEPISTPREPAPHDRRTDTYSTTDDDDAE